MIFELVSRSLSSITREEEQMGKYIKVEMQKIKDDLARFASSTPEPITRRSSTFSNKAFGDIKDGDEFIAVFSVTEKTRRLIKIFHPDSPETSDSVEKTDKEFSEMTNEKSWIGNVFFPEYARELFESASLVAKHESVTILITGKSGFGKTTYPRAWADYSNMAFYRFNCASALDAEEWFGHREMRNGETVFIATPLTEAIEKGNAIIVLDEINRVEPWIHNTLLPLLDDDRKTRIHDRDIIVGPNVIFALTANIGPEFTGTFELDTAFSNRIDAAVEVVAPKSKVERAILTRRYHNLNVGDAKAIVDIIGHLRATEFSDTSIDISTRVSLKAAKLVALGKLTVKKAFEFCVFSQLYDGDKKIAIDLVNLHLSKKQAELTSSQDEPRSEVWTKTKKSTIISSSFT